MSSMAKIIADDIPVAVARALEEDIGSGDISAQLIDAQKEALELGKNEKAFAKTLVERWIGNRVDYSDS